MSLTIDELVALLPEPITEYTDFFIEYQGLRDWGLYALLRMRQKSMSSHKILWTSEGPECGSTNPEYVQYVLMLRQHLMLALRLLT